MGQRGARLRCPRRAGHDHRLAAPRRATTRPPTRHSAPAPAGSPIPGAAGARDTDGAGPRYATEEVRRAGWAGRSRMPCEGATRRCEAAAGRRATAVLVAEGPPGADHGTWRRTTERDGRAPRRWGECGAPSGTGRDSAAAPRAAGPA